MIKVNNKFISFLEKKGFVIKDKDFLGDFHGKFCYNRYFSTYSEKYVDYLEFPYRSEVEVALSIFNRKEVNNFLEEIKNKDKIILKKILFN
jgi:hypothetical protein